MDVTRFGGRYEDGIPNFGYIPPEQRTVKQQNAVEDCMNKMPRFAIGPDLSGSESTKRENENKEKVCIFDLWKHPAIVAANGFAYTGNHQLTGCCVGAGGGNALFSVGAADAIIRGEPEEALVPFWLLPYGKSRSRMGDHGQGEGSTGTTFADAVREDGTIPAKTEGLPKFTTEDGLIWGNAAEMKWSAGDSQPAEFVNAAKKFLVKTTAECKSADDVQQAIANYYPVTIASSWGGGMRCQVESGVLLNSRQGTWNHQMSIQAFWIHPQLGRLFWIQNQWGLSVHGSDPAGGPGGGFWVKESEVAWICRGGEVFAFSQWQGFPAQTIDWYV